MCAVSYLVRHVLYYSREAENYTHLTNEYIFVHLSTIPPFSLLLLRKPTSFFRPVLTVSAAVQWYGVGNILSLTENMKDCQCQLRIETKKV